MTKSHAAQDKAEALKARADDDATPMTRAEALAEIAGDYGDRSFQNYSAVRNIAITLRDQLRAYMCMETDCVQLVPPSGKFGARDYGSAAFSVSGRGFLPLEPISFGLAVRVSGKKDYLRIVLTVRKEGTTYFITPDTGKPYRVTRPEEGREFPGGTFDEVVEGLYSYLVDWFARRIDRYDNGDYGSNDIGFDIIRAVLAEDLDGGDADDIVVDDNALAASGDTS